MFSAGDTIVHKRYGAGTVIGLRKMERKGQECQYLCVEMIDNAGTLMIPEDQLEEDDMRPALTDTRLIKEILFKEPEELTDHHRSRQMTIEEKLSTHDPRKVTQVLRDLCWRQHITKLTTTDMRLKKSAFTLLMQELMLNSAFTLTKAEQRLDNLIDQAMAHHQGVTEAS
jgi:RNA polymerase-interacting CarD/CdnL/TRCF family regulator